MGQIAAARHLPVNLIDFTILHTGASLQWLPIYVRSDLKVLLMTYTFVSGLIPSYLSDLIIPHQIRRSTFSEYTAPIC